MTIWEIYLRLGLGALLISGSGILILWLWDNASGPDSAGSDGKVPK